MKFQKILFAITLFFVAHQLYAMPCVQYGEYYLVGGVFGLPYGAIIDNNDNTGDSISPKIFQAAPLNFLVDIQNTDAAGNNFALVNHVHMAFKFINATVGGRRKASYHYLVEGNTGGNFWYTVEDDTISVDEHFKVGRSKVFTKEYYLAKPVNYTNWRVTFISGSSDLLFLPEFSEIDLYGCLALATATFTVTHTPTVTNTRTHTNTPTATNTKTHTNTVTNTQTVTDTQTVTMTWTNPNTPTTTYTQTATNTSTNTATASSSATNTGTSTATSSSTATSTKTLTNTRTLTNSPTNTQTASGTATMTVSNTATTSATHTSTATSSSTNTALATHTMTHTATNTSTNTNTVLNTATSTLTRTYTSKSTATITATASFTNTTTTANACSGVADWNGNFVAYSIGQKVVYNGELYQCIQAHSSQSTWEPNVVPALWKDLGPCGSNATASSTISGTVTNATATGSITPSANCSGVPVWSGNFVSYSINQRVVYNGELYQCIQAHSSENTWEPNVTPALWKDLGACSTAPTASNTPSFTPTPSLTFTMTSTNSGTSTATVLSTSTTTPTQTPTVTASVTSTATTVFTATSTASDTSTPTSTFSSTNTATVISTATSPVLSTCPPNTVSGASWSLSTNATGFEGRYYAAAVTFNNALWMIGGSGTPQSTHQVLTSLDGTNWTQVTANPAYGQRLGQTSLVFDAGRGSEMWVIAGNNTSSYLNNVWHSLDGINWVEATNNAAFAARETHAAVVFNNKMWVIGGANTSNQLLGDVWNSTDGASWTQTTASAAFGPRTDLAAAAFNGEIWVIGGLGNNGLLNDVWHSADGVTWTQAPTAPFTPRYDHSCFTFDNRLWVIGGAGPGTTLYNDVWYTTDGSHWVQATASASFSPRAAQSSAVFDGRIWIMAGRAANYAYQDDVWKTDCDTQPAALVVKANVAPNALLVTVKDPTPTATATLTSTPTATATPNFLIESVVAAPNVSRGYQPVHLMYQLTQPATVHLSLYTLLGQSVLEMNLPGNTGANEWQWNLQNQGHGLTASGLYIYRLTAHNGTLSEYRQGKIAIIH